MKLLLGSNSPRRNELLTQIGLNFTKVSIACDEDFSSRMKVNEVAQYLAEKKANAYLSLSDSEILVTADTVVICNGKMLNKPKDKKDAFDMLSMLSNTTHQVITGVCIRTLAEGLDSFSSITEVHIDELTVEQIEFYIKNYEPYDKAGAYGIQEWFGLVAVKGITGCYYNVVGLPCSELYKRLNDSYELD